MFAGLVLAVDYGGAHLSGPAMVNEPVAVVLVIAAILAFAISAFVLGLAAGTLRRSDVCRTASVITQCVFGALILAGSVEAIQTQAGLTLAFDPASGPAFLVTPASIAILLTSCVAVAALLLCRPSSYATQARYRRRYR
jgi:hypothetical protein